MYNLYLLVLLIQLDDIIRFSNNIYIQKIIINIKFLCSRVISLWARPPTRWCLFVAVFVDFPRAACVHFLQESGPSPTPRPSSFVWHMHIFLYSQWIKYYHFEKKILTCFFLQSNPICQYILSECELTWFSTSLYRLYFE